LQVAMVSVRSLIHRYLGRDLVRKPVIHFSGSRSNGHGKIRATPDERAPLTRGRSCFQGSGCQQQ
jgi:hypothetical protein